MTYVNSSDLSYSIIEEVTAGVTPTSTGVRYALPLSAENAPLVAATDQIPSSTLMPDRSAAPTQSGMTNISGTFDLRAQYAPVVDLLFSSALSGKWAANKLKGGAQDTYFSVITKYKDNTAAGENPANGMFTIDAGCIVNSMSLSGNVNDGVTLSFEVMGTARTESATDNARPVTAVPNTAREFIFTDVRNFMIGEEAIEVSSVDFSLGNTRTARGVLGAQDAKFIGTEGARDTTLTLRAYRQSFEVNALANQTKRKISFEFGPVGAGYRLTLHGAITQIPTDEKDGSNMIVSIPSSASYDSAEGTDVTIEKI